MRIAPDGWVVIGPFVAVSLLLGAAAWWLLPAPVAWAVAGLLLLLCGWCLWFFRDPDRVTPSDPGAVISPADGVVIKIDRTALPAEIAAFVPEVAPGDQVDRVIIFLNVFNVHVNRCVATGVIAKIRYTKGQFLTASVDKASLENERCAVLMRDTQGRAIVFSQIAGLVARRIVNHLREGQAVTAGERYGLIRFGSRAEIFLPHGSAINVVKGQKVVCGQTVLATMAPADTVKTVHHHASAGVPVGG